jgi:hypothetical protein
MAPGQPVRLRRCGHKCDQAPPQSPGGSRGQGGSFAGNVGGLKMLSSTRFNPPGDLPIGPFCEIMQELHFQTMLTGAELLAKVKELGDVSKSDLVRACGYVSTKKDGTERLNFTAFYESLLNAKGVDFGATPKAGKAGRKLSFNTKVQFNGNLMVGKAYTAMLDLKPGDEFEIKLGRKQIRLVPLGAEDEDV